METRGPVRRPRQESDRRHQWFQLDEGGTSGGGGGVGGGLCVYFEEKSDSIY